jgi:hypothetical protein
MFFHFFFVARFRTRGNHATQCRIGHVSLPEKASR